ncbi:uncharacterized protein CXQ87_004868 [Candidozyma duobushaemuli]|uniref:Prefoldin subunit 6 n=1 Tax=Candidozyma duobushaemuli TaxID=1231522 RepID=A0A2V1AH82_9ASCO|nr:uncharacterized protein CXQ87_004868 [[Candida] duobushaemulonis]PVH16573.1 hypothetical protein CXQ87_004868 [[Candida] duobushaemulonis]
MASVAEQFEKLSLDFTQSQTQLQELSAARSQLETQLQENKIVLEEFGDLDESAQIYKLTGPVLMPQDFAEAKLNVTKRIEFIEGEIRRVEEKLEKQQQHMEETRGKLLQTKSQMA